MKSHKILFSLHCPNTIPWESSSTNIFLLIICYPTTKKQRFFAHRLEEKHTIDKNNCIYVEYTIDARHKQKERFEDASLGSYIISTITITQPYKLQIIIYLTVEDKDKKTLKKNFLYVCISYFHITSAIYIYMQYYKCGIVEVKKIGMRWKLTYRKLFFLQLITWLCQERRARNSK